MYQGGSGGGPDGNDSQVFGLGGDIIRRICIVLNSEATVSI